MTALIRYMLVDLFRSNRYFMPTLAFGIFVAWMYSLKPNPVLESYGVTMALLFAVAVWFGFLLCGVESKRQQELTVLHAGGFLRYAQARLALLGLAGLAAAIYAILVPIVLKAFDREVTAEDLLLAFYCHMVAFALGSGIAWFAEVLLRKSNAVLGFLLLVLALSFAAGGLEEILPAWGRWLTWLLPPIYRLLQSLSVYESLGKSRLLLNLAYSALYTAVLYAVLIKLFISRRI